MATWAEFAKAEPEFAERAREVLAAHRHKTIATLRADGAPRISGIEAEITGGELVFGSMPRAVKALDLRRDPRFALHSASVIDASGDPASWPGDVKVSGRAVEITDPEQRAALLGADGKDAEQFADSHFFIADLQEVVFTSVRDDLLHIDLWKPGHPLHHHERT